MSDTYRSRAAEFCYVGIIRRIDTHIAAFAFLIFIDPGIQYFRCSFAAHIIQIHYACHGTGSSLISHAYGHTAVGHHGSNGMGCGRIHYHAGLCFFLTAFLQPADTVFPVIALTFFKGSAGPGVPAYSAVNQIFFIIGVFFQFAVRLNGIVVIAPGHNFTVVNQGKSLSGDFIIRTCHTNSGSYTLPADTHIQHAGIIGNGFVAPGHHAHVARTVDVRLFNCCYHIILNVIVAAGTSCRRRSFHGSGSTHGHAEYIAFRCSTDIQIAYVHGRICLFFSVCHTCRCFIFNAVYANRNYTGQEGIRPGELHGSCAGL